jgi:hypothetical protein
MIAKIKRFFSRLFGKGYNPDLFNIHHPDFADAVEPAFKVGDIQYYRFKSEVRMPWSRYSMMQNFLSAQELRLDPELLAGFIQVMRKAINVNAKGIIDLTTLIRTIDALDSRQSLQFEVNTTYTLASIMYFDETEDMFHYDRAHNEKKVKTWMEAKVVDFFYTRPMGELLGLSGTSPQDLVAFMDQQRELLAVLNEPILETSKP